MYEYLCLCNMYVGIYICNTHIHAYIVKTSENKNENKNTYLNGKKR